jgi:hypothetical protein
MNEYGAYCNRPMRILLLLTLVMFAAHFVDAISLRASNRDVVSAVASRSDAGAARARGGATAFPRAQETPQRPTKPAKPATDARPRTEEVAPAESADAEHEQGNADMQRQLADFQRQLEQEALNRMRNGRTNFDFSGLWSDFAPVLAWAAFLVAAVWIVRISLDNRRWNKMVKVQMDTHTKLLDRFASSQEMLAYMQSDAGRKFLEAPLFEDQRRQVSVLPFSRILWSVQVGIVAAFFGAGILFLRGRVAPDADVGFQVFGTLILTLGIGFLVSGAVSYVLAKYFGLLERRDALARSEPNA